MNNCIGLQFQTQRAKVKTTLKVTHKKSSTVFSKFSK